MESNYYENKKLFGTLRRRNAHSPFSSSCEIPMPLNSPLSTQTVSSLRGFEDEWTKSPASTRPAHPTQIPTTNSHASDPLNNHKQQLPIQIGLTIFKKRHEIEMGYLPNQ